MVTLKLSKRDPFGAGFVFHSGRTDNVLCPVAAYMLAYLACRWPWSGFLFRFSDGSPLTREHMCMELWKVLQYIGGMNTSGHSFRIGGATVAAHRGISDSLKTFGRGKSAAFMEYTRTDIATLTSIAAKLAR